MPEPIRLITDPAQGHWWRGEPISEYEDSYHRERHEPEVQWRSEHLRVWHAMHWWRFGGCLRWVTELTVQGSPRHVVVYGEHLEP